ncbi:hypothetical protein SORBI_3006G225100 [Sorghum bicolor]|uniref:KIB1-4 beta-propeller domain-containing protein n=1 Tax=Sorghum bicolor TaxID=4558 RepID=A0A1Z5RF58_SORBI|nr:hypothetical protein SORBI_3006G225100 [Sorghum bicolor]
MLPTHACATWGNTSSPRHRACSTLLNLPVTMLGFCTASRKIDERSELHLVNPLTGEQVALPSVMTIEHVKPIFDVSGAIHKYELSYDIWEVSLPPSLHDPSDLRECLYFKISFARPGDDKWTWVGQVIMDEMTYPICESMYIIQAPWGDLLQVSRTVEVLPNAPWYVPGSGNYRARTLKTKVCKVDLEAKQLMEINRLPCHILFLGHNNSLCLSAEGHPGLKSNHAYFTDDLKELTVEYKNSTRDMGVMDLENSVKKDIVSQIWSNWPCPTWITPNLMKLNLAFSK